MRLVQVSSTESISSISASSARNGGVLYLKRGSGNIIEHLVCLRFFNFRFVGKLILKEEPVLLNSLVV